MRAYLRCADWPAMLQLMANHVLWPSAPMRTDLLSKRINRKTTSHMLRPFFDDELEALDYDLLPSKGSIDE